ncbi:MAG: tRNA 2-selenouridine(34) synthase MnmH [Trichlorobacter sp.]|nr:tRNA 2-selenouridine(34) synthase MnmH [Trichlorobacter sp.]
MSDKTVAFAPALLASHCVIDVRTPLEFAEDHLPGACNVPLLTNAERIEVGTLYKQQGALIAKERGLQLTCHRFPALVASIARLAAGRPILVYCWRGGMRSESVVTLLEGCGHQAVKLTGGYKSFRGFVNRYFENFTPSAPLLVLHGMTGSGKTEFLHLLAAKGWNTVDLEGLAHHRGSAFGSLGLGKQPTQKRFETTLWQAFISCKPGKPIVLEGESRRIGWLLLPGNLYDVMDKAHKIWTDVSVETRVNRLAAEYAKQEFRPQMKNALERIRKKIDGNHYPALQHSLDTWDVTGLAKGLVEHYYDRLYYKVKKWEPAMTISLEDYDAAEQQLSDYARKLIKAPA